MTPVTRGAVRAAVAALADGGKSYVKSRDVANELGVGRERATLSSIGKHLAALADDGALEKWSSPKAEGHATWRIVDAGAGADQPDAGSDDEASAADGESHTGECDICGEELDGPKLPEHLLGHAADGPEPIADGGTDTGVTEQCPSCGVVGDKTQRVGTFKCTTRACRVHFYQRADEHHDVAVGAPAAETEHEPIADGSGCWYCQGQTEYHPTCAAPGCSADTHGHGPDGKVTYNYCPRCRGDAPEVRADGGRRGLGAIQGADVLDLDDTDQAVLAIQGARGTASFDVPAGRVGPLQATVRELGDYYVEDEAVTDGGTSERFDFENRTCPGCSSNAAAWVGDGKVECSDCHGQFIADLVDEDTVEFRDGSGDVVQTVELEPDGESGGDDR